MTRLKNGVGIKRGKHVCIDLFMNLDQNTGLILIHRSPLDQRQFEVLQTNLGGVKTVLLPPVTLEWGLPQTHNHNGNLECS